MCVLMETCARMHCNDVEEDIEQVCKGIAYATQTTKLRGRSWYIYSHLHQGRGGDFLSLDGYFFREKKIT